MHPAVGASRPVVVVTALPLEKRAREALAAALGPGHVVTDIRDNDGSADIVVAPPCSPQALAALARAFPDARLLVAEVEDEGLGVDLGGPVGRILDGGADGYLIARSIDDLAAKLATPTGALPAGAAHALGQAQVDDLVLAALAQRERSRSS